MVICFSVLLACAVYWTCAVGINGSLDAGGVPGESFVWDDNEYYKDNNDFDDAACVGDADGDDHVNYNDLIILAAPYDGQLGGDGIRFACGF